ncbi:MAG: N-acetylmuramoyl-L-alanine amidase [Ruminococcus sp.]|nr:N-acetylmuramoyl-L-alanine amidase [Ruminococcus sp.]
MAAAVSGRSLLMSEGAMPYIKADAELKVRPEMPQVVLDAGHGGMDGGCVSVNGVAEKGINLAIVQSESDMLTLLGFETVLTRDSDKSIYDDGVTGLGEQKKSDMKNRLAIFSSTKGIALSIHQNQFTDSRYSGAQMFYSRRNSGGEKLAAAMQKQFVALLQPDNARETKPVDDELFLLDRTEAPAVMIECGFLSNPEEAAHLEDPVYQRKVAFTIASGVLSFHAGEIGS